ncbi:nestin [Rhinophrynus dorsalis]
MEKMEMYLGSLSVGEESTLMWNLNKRLEAYLSRVKALEEENELLRAEIHNLKSSKAEKCWKKKFHEEMMKLRDALDDGHREMVEAEMERDSIYEEVEFVKQRCLEERQLREDATKELSESKKLLEEEKRAQIWLKERLIQLEGELEDILKVHEEETAQMEQEISRFSQRLENFRVTPIAVKPVDLEDYASKLSAIWQGAVEEYKCEISVLETNLSEANENLKKVLEENKQNRLHLQNLDKELVSLKMRKEMLEDLLSKQWQDQQDDEGKLQLEMEALEQEKRDLRAQIAEILEDRQQLMHLKMSLSLEVATYRSLLEAESTRIYTPGTDYKISSTFSDSIQEQINARKRQTEDTRKLVSREQRFSYANRQSREKKEQTRSTPNRLANVRTSGGPSRASPVTKEFQKVSSVLQSQGLKYTNGPSVKASKTVSTVESHSEKLPQSREVFSKTKRETVSQTYSRGSSKATSEPLAKETKDLSGLDKKAFLIKDKELTNIDNMDNIESKEVAVAQFETNVLKSSLKEENQHRAPSDFVIEDEQIYEKEAKQACEIQLNEKFQEETFELDVPQTELSETKAPALTSEGESGANADEADIIEVKEVSNESVSCQQAYFEKKDVIETLNYKYMDSKGEEFAEEENASDIFSTDNNAVSDIISKSTGGLLGNEFQIVSGPEFTSHQLDESDGHQPFDSKCSMDMLSDGKPDTAYDEGSLQDNQEEQKTSEISDVKQDNNKLYEDEEYSLRLNQEEHKHLELADAEQETELAQVQQDGQLLEDVTECITVSSTEQNGQILDKTEQTIQSDYAEQNANTLSDVKQLDKQFFEDEKDILQSNQEDQKSFELSDGEEDSVKLNQEQNSQLSDDEDKRSQNISDTQESDQVFNYADQVNQVDDSEKVVNQLEECKQDIKQVFDDEEEILKQSPEEQRALDLSDVEQHSNSTEVTHREDSQLSDNKQRSDNIDDMEENIIDLEEIRQSVDENQDFDKQDDNHLFGDYEDSQQQTLEEPKSPEYIDEEQDVINLSNERQESPLLQDEGKSLSVSNESESDDNKVGNAMEDTEEHHDHSNETEDNISLEKDGDADNLSKSTAQSTIFQEEMDVISKQIDMPENREENEPQELLYEKEHVAFPDEQEILFSMGKSHKEEEYSLSSYEQVQDTDQNTSDEKVDQEVFDNEIGTTETEEHVFENQLPLEKMVLFTNENVVESELQLQEPSENIEEDDTLEGKYVMQNVVEVKQVITESKEFIEGVDDLEDEVLNEEVYQGSVLSENEKVRSDSVTELLCESNVSENEQTPQKLESNLDSQMPEMIADDDEQLCLQKETEYLKEEYKEQLTAQSITEEQLKVESEENVDDYKEEHLSTVVQADDLSVPNPSETLEYEDDNDSAIEIQVQRHLEEQQREFEDMPTTTAVSKTENENSESEESVDSQEEISAYSQKMEESEISKDYLLEETLPDSTPLPKCEDGDVAEEQTHMSSEQHDSQDDIKHQKKDESGETFLLSDETDEPEANESISKAEEYNEEQYFLQDPESALNEDSTREVVNQEQSCLGDSKDSDDSIEKAGILEEGVSEVPDEFVIPRDFASAMLKSKIIQLGEMPEFIDRTTGFEEVTEDSNESETNYQTERCGDNVACAVKPNDNNITEVVDEQANELKSQGDNYAINVESESENTITFDKTSIQVDQQMDVKQSQGSENSDSEATASSDEGSPNVTLSHVSDLKDSKTGIVEDSYDDMKDNMASEDHGSVILENVEDRATQGFTERLFSASSVTEVEYGSQEKEAAAETSDSSVDSYDIDEAIQFKEEKAEQFDKYILENNGKVNGTHEHVEEGRLDGAEEMLNGHSNRDYSEIVFSEQKIFEKEIPEDSIIKYAMSEAKSEGFFQSLLETSEPKDSSRLDEVLLTSEMKTTIGTSDYLESAEESKFTMLVQNPYLNDNNFNDQTQTITIKSGVDEEMVFGTNQEISETYEGTNIPRGEEASWTSDNYMN